MNPATADHMSPAARAAVLAEALPYIRRFWGKVIVVKHGGNAISASAAAGLAARASTAEPTAGEPTTTSEAATSGGRADTTIDPSLASFAQDIVLMSSVGMRPVVVHGGGPQIGELMTRLGKEPVFRGGLRVTDADTLDIARMVLVGKVNRDIVGAINVHGPLAVGLSGEDAGLITASAHPDQLGFVGEVKAVNPTILQRLLAQDLIPVVATIGSDPTGQAYNINADTAAGAVAEVLGAEKLVYLTNVEGLRRDVDDPSTLVHATNGDELEAMIADGTLSDGMIPKAAACVRAVRSGVGHAHILDGRVPHALLLEIYTREGVGTMVSR